MTLLARYNIVKENILDITDIHCPLTFVKVKITLSQMDSGDELMVILKDGEPMENVPEAVKRNGHTVIKIEKDAEHIYKMLIKKK